LARKKLFYDPLGFNFRVMKDAVGSVFEPLQEIIKCGALTIFHELLLPDAMDRAKATLGMSRQYWPDLIGPGTNQDSAMGSVVTKSTNQWKA
jgi:hypothetical protein